MVEKTKRKLSWDIYIVGFLITLAIFLVGFFIGTKFEKSVISKLQSEITRMEEKQISLEVMSMEEPEIFCNFVIDEMENFDEETREIGEKVGYIEKRRGIDPSLKSEYMTLETRDYLLFKRIKRSCNLNTTVILYFLNSSDGISMKQGEEVTKARENIGNVRVYSFDIDVANELVKSLSNFFNITTTPSLVINEKRYEGFLNEDEIIEKIRVR